MVYACSTITSQFTKKLSRQKMNVALYQEMATLFEIYHTLVASDVQCEKLPAMQLLRDIGHTFYVNVDVESLLRVYPMLIRYHVQFYLMNDLHDQTEYMMLLTQLFDSDHIQNNEWLATEWLLLNKFYAHCVGTTNFPKEVPREEIEIYLIQEKRQHLSELQQLWLAMVLEEWRKNE